MKFREPCTDLISRRQWLYMPILLVTITTLRILPERVRHHIRFSGMCVLGPKTQRPIATRPSSSRNCRLTEELCLEAKTAEKKMCIHHLEEWRWCKVYIGPVSPRTARSQLRYGGILLAMQPLEPAWNKVISYANHISDSAICLF